MSNYTIGPKIGLDGEKEFRQQLNNINENLRTLDSELKKTTSEFQDNADSEEALTRVNQTLNKQIELQEDKLQAVKKALDYASKEYGETATQTQKWQRVVNNTETDLNNLRSQLKKNENALNGMDSSVDKVESSLNEMSDSADQASDSAEKLSNISGGIKTGFSAIAGGVAGVIAATTAGVAAINDITESTREYREDIGKLETAFTTAGLSTDVATETYKNFYSILGEEDRSVEAVNHLAKLTTSEEDLNKWTNICAGVWGTFGDSLPIEGLTEASNETAKTGKVVGVLADALNWAGVSEDEFNQKLALCSSEQERSALITNTLNGLYDEAAKNYKAANGEIIDARLAQSELTDATAALGKELEPVSTSFKLFGAEILKSLVPGVQQLSEGLQQAFNGDEGADVNIANGIESIILSLVDTIDKIIPTLITVMETVAEALLSKLIEMLPRLSSLAIDLILSLVNAVIEQLPLLMDAAISIVVYLANAISEQLPTLIPTMINAILTMVETLTSPENLSNLINAALQLILALTQGLMNALPNLVEKAPEIILSLIITILSMLPQIVETAYKVISEFIRGLLESRSRITKNFTELLNDVFDKLQNGEIIDRALEWGKDMIQAIINGISSMINNLGNAALDVADTISSYLHFSVPDKGPLVDVPNWMPDMIDEMTKGIYNEEGKLETAAGSLAGKLATGLNMNAELTNTGFSKQTLIIDQPIILDGRIIANNTQKYISSQQSGFAMSRGKMNVRF